MSAPRATTAPMKTITAIRAKGRARDRYVIEFDGTSGPTLDSELVVKLSVHIGDTLDARAEQELIDAAGRLGAYDRAVRMLAAAGRGREDLRRRLVQKGERPEHAAAAVERLAAQGLIDDAAFARSYVRSKAAGHGKRRIAMDLARKGITKDAVAAALEEALPDATDTAESIERLVERKLRSLASYDAATRYRRLLGFLARRGFGADEIRRALSRIPR